MLALGVAGLFDLGRKLVRRPGRSTACGMRAVRLRALGRQPRRAPRLRPVAAKGSRQLPNKAAGGGLVAVRIAARQPNRLNVTAPVLAHLRAARSSVMKRRSRVTTKINESVFPLSTLQATTPPSKGHRWRTRLRVHRPPASWRPQSGTPEAAAIGPGADSSAGARCTRAECARGDPVHRGSIARSGTTAVIQAAPAEAGRPAPRPHRRQPRCSYTA